MKKIISLILISLLIVNCEDGADSGSQTNPSDGTQTKLSGELFSRDINDMGEVAQYIIENDSHFNDFYYELSPIGGYLYSDAQIVFAIRGYIATKAVDTTNGMVDFVNGNKLDYIKESIIETTGSSRGLNRLGLCIATADIYNSFGFETNLIQVSGANHTLSDSGNYCGVDVIVPNGTVFIDSFINRSFHTDSILWMSSSEMLQAHESGQVSLITLNPDGQMNAMPNWQDSTGDYYHTLESNYPANGDWETEVQNLQENTFDNVTVTPYQSIR